MSSAWVVTGANKGIGLSIAKGLLEAGCFVLLGSRDAGRGQAAIKTLVDAQPDFAERVQLLELDVTDSASIEAATQRVTGLVELGGALAGIINNAGGSMTGMGEQGTPEAHQATIDLNYHAVVAVTTAFLPLIKPNGGRVIMVSSGAAPSFVSKLSKERQALFVDPAVTMGAVQALLDEVASIRSSAENPSAALTSVGLNAGSYGLSKAALNCYAQLLARENPGLGVNACTPGWVETDLTAGMGAGKTREEMRAMGMISVDEGAVTPLYLALGDLPTPTGVAWFYGSDQKRSPLHKYRSPRKEPAFDGNLD